MTPRRALALVLVVLVALGAWLAWPDRGGVEPSAIGAAEQDASPATVEPRDLRATKVAEAVRTPAAGDASGVPAGTAAPDIERESALRVRLVYTAGGAPAVGLVVLTDGARVISAESSDVRGEAVLAVETPLSGADLAERSENDDKHLSVDPSGAPDLSALGAVELSAAGPFRPLVRRPLAELATQQDERGAFVRVPVERGAAIAGRVLVDGAPPAEPVELALVPEPDGDALHALHHALGRAVFPLALRRRATTTSPDGAFRIEGLAPGWRGELRAPRGLLVLERSGSVRSPADDHVLRLARSGGLTGRLVRAGGAPVADARVDWTVDCARDGGRNPAPGDGRTDGSGGFWVPFVCPTERSIELAFTAEAGPAGEPAGYRALTVPPVDPMRVTELGDVVLAEVYALDLSVVDVRGAPIAGAVARTPCVERVRSEPTGADGRTSYASVPADCETLIVSAVGYRPATISLPPPFGAAFCVELPATTAVEVRVAYGAGGALAIPLLARLDAASDPLRGGQHAWREAAAHRRRWNLRSTPDGRFALLAELDATGRALFDDLEPDAGVRVRVVGDVGHVLFDAGVLRLVEGERRRVPVALPDLAPPRPLEGIVLGDGEPLFGASVTYVAVGSPEPYAVRWIAETAADGRFTTRPTYASALQLEVAARGFRKLVIPEAPLPPTGELLDLHLDRGRAATLRVRGADGAARECEAVEVRQGGERVGVARATGAPGEIALANLPDAELECVCRAHGQRWRTPLGAEASEATLVLPPCGALVVRSRLELAHGTTLRLEGRRRGASGDDARLVAHARADGGAELVIELPLVRAGTWDLELAAAPPGRLDGAVVVATLEAVVVEADGTTDVELAAR